MNKTKRKIFETSMNLFAQKGYEATSIEEITSVVGVAKGTLYYHFSSKDEIFNFLVEEGMNLLKNSILIKTSKVDNVVDKLKSIILIQIKVLLKYENFITILLSQIWGHEPRNLMCKNYAFDYINIIKEIIDVGITNGEISNVDSEVLASSIFGFTCSSLLYKIKTEKELDVQTLYHEYVNILLGKYFK